jgi:hypothetical protein
VRQNMEFPCLPLFSSLLLVFKLKSFRFTTDHPAQKSRPLSLFFFLSLSLSLCNFTIIFCSQNIKISYPLIYLVLLKIFFTQNEGVEAEVGEEKEVVERQKTT